VPLVAAFEPLSIKPDFVFSVRQESLYFQCVGCVLTFIADEYLKLFWANIASPSILLLGNSFKRFDYFLP
jgi:hypothetical protein